MPKHKQTQAHARTQSYRDDEYPMWMDCTKNNFNEKALIVIIYQAIQCWTLEAESYKSVWLLCASVWVNIFILGGWGSHDVPWGSDCCRPVLVVALHGCQRQCLKNFRLRWRFTFLRMGDKRWSNKIRSHFSIPLGKTMSEYRPTTRTGLQQSEPQGYWLDIYPVTYIYRHPSFRVNGHMALQHHIRLDKPLTHTATIVAWLGNIPGSCYTLCHLLWRDSPPPNYVSVGHLFMQAGTVYG